MNPVLFLLLALLTLTAALTVVLHPKPVHSACALVVTLFVLSVFFVALDAQLIGVLQIVVYAGAIVVLLLFVIMLLNLQMESHAFGPGWVVAAAVGGGLMLAAVLVSQVWWAPGGAGPAVSAEFGYPKEVAQLLFTTYLLPFELTSVLLLVAIVGAVALTKKGLQ